MSLNTIRAFKVGDRRYRHAMCYDNDAVYLQRYTDNEEATCDDDLWTTLISYDRNCVARLADGTKIGDFQLENLPNHWVFYESPNRTRIDFGPINGAEALLETELLYSRRWLITQELQSPEHTGTLAHAAHLQAKIDAIANQQDNALRPRANMFAKMVHEARTPAEVLLLIANLNEWPMGFFRSELRVALTRRLAELSAEKTTVPAGAAKTAPQ